LDVFRSIDCLVYLGENRDSEKIRENRDKKNRDKTGTKQGHKTDKTGTRQNRRQK
jgi:hypothetical protein